MLQEWTTAQAAFVLGEPLETLKREIDRGPIKARIVKVGGLRVRKFVLTDLVFLHVQRELKNDLTPKGRTELYMALSKVPASRTRQQVKFGDLKFEYGRHLKEVKSKLRELESFAHEIDGSGSEVKIKGTSIEVFRISALLDGGMTVGDVLRDYPSLVERQVRAAQAFAETNPKIGRPFPKTTAKAALRGSGLDALDTDD